MMPANHSVLTREHRWGTTIEDAFQALPAAIKDMEKVATLTHNPMVKATLGSLYALAGRRADALKVLAELHEASKHRFVSPPQANYHGR
jgi:hypothetical protein